MITLSGLMIIIITTAIGCIYDPTLEGKGPNWLYLLYSISLFAYQSLDAIDGKQARRTNTSGPLGELFDHGCDAVSTAFIMIMNCSCTGLGNGYWLAIAMFSGILKNIFYV